MKVFVDATFTHNQNTKLQQLLRLISCVHLTSCGHLSYIVGLASNRLEKGKVISPRILKTTKEYEVAIFLVTKQFLIKTTTTLLEPPMSLPNLMTRQASEHKCRKESYLA